MAFQPFHIEVIAEFIAKHSPGPDLVCAARPRPVIGINGELVRQQLLRHGLSPSRGAGSNRQEGVIEDDRDAFAMMGFETVHSFDISDRDDPSFLFDLNSEEVPGEYRNRYDMLISMGTLEHVFHIPNALANMTAMIKTGGTVLHLVPVHNYLDHGYYQISPVLFFDYHVSNGYEVLESRLYSSDRIGIEADWRPLDTYFDPYATEQPRYLGAFGAGYVIYLFAARKLMETGARNWPEQGYYLRLDGRENEQKKATKT